MKRVSGWKRIAIGISLLWLVSLFLTGLIVEEIPIFLAIGIISVLVVWVIERWIAKRFKSDKTDKAEDVRVDVDSITEELRDIQAKLHKLESELSKLEKTK